MSKDLQAAVGKELQKGTNPFAIPTTLQLSQYQDLPGYDNWFSENVQAVLYDFLLGPIGWRPERETRSVSRSSPCTAPPSSSTSSSSLLPTQSSSSGRGRYNKNSFQKQINNFKFQSQNSFSQSGWRPVRSYHSKY